MHGSMPATVVPVPPAPSEAAFGSSRLRAAARKAAAYVALTKPRIIELLLVTTVPAMVVAERGWPGTWLVIATLIGGSLAAGGANAINMYVDRDIDAVMERTKGRPLVTGALTPRAALTFAITIEVAAFFWLWATANLLAAALAVSACLFYVFVYTLWLKRTSQQNIVIGGAAGAVPVLVGWAAVTNSLSATAWLLFAVVFFWTPPHFWALAIKYRDDYARADVPMLPVVDSMRSTVRQIVAYTVVVSLVALTVAPVADLGGIYLAVAAASGAAFLWRTVQLARRPSIRNAMRTFGFSITYLTLVFAALAIDQLV